MNILRRLGITLVAAVAALVIATPAADAAAQRWMCTDPRTGWTVVTSNGNLAHYLYRGGYRCTYVYNV